MKISDNISSLEKITIVIPTYFRFKHLKRLLNFFFSYDSKIQILVLDSTPKNIKKDNELIKLLKKNKVEYIQYSEDTRISIKIDNGLKNVKTKYATLCSDDDYLIPGCLSKCINFLEVNNDYTSTLGITCIHNLTTESKFIMAHLYTRAKSLMKKSARERFLDVYIYKKQGISPFYAVHRTKDLQFFWNETVKFTTGVGYVELIPTALSFIYGKMKTLPFFYSSRERNNISWYSDTDTLKKIHSKYNSDKAIECIKKHLSIVDNISLEEADNFLKLYSFDPFPSKLINSKNQLSLINYKKKLNYYYYEFNQYIYHKIIIRLSIKNILNHFFRISKGCPIVIYPKGFSDFEKVKLSVISSNCLSDDLNLGRKKNLENSKLIYGDECSF